MRKKLYFHHLLLGMAIFMSSCSENEDSIPANPGDAISFSAATPQSRTYYSEWLQLDWVKDDRIGIYSAEANELDADKDKPKSAEYEITDIYKDEDHEHHADFAPVGDDGLKWGSYNDHTFYGAYPAERIETYPNEVDMKGMFQMKYMTNQVCTVNPLDNNTNMYTTTPDMKNAYMVAKKTLPPNSKDHVLLTFRPVMTTLQINVTAGSTGSDIGTGIIPEPTTLTGVSVIMPKALKDGKFLYDVDNSKLKEGSVLDGKESVFVSFDNNDERYIKLNAGEKISFLVFLPPVLMDVSERDTAKLRIHTTGYQNYVIPMNGNLQQEYKFDIKLPDFDPERIQPNNWMSYMDDKVYVSQLSIPGSYKKLQSIQAGNLLNMGVRALDLRSATGDEMKTITGEIESFLGKNSQEFVIALCKAGSSISSNKVEVIHFNADMTLADARGKILVINEGDSGITFNNYTDSKTAISTLISIGENTNRAWTVTYCAYDEMSESDIANSNKAIYKHIVNTQEGNTQEGNTGIVMIPYACTQKILNSGTGIVRYISTYGDLFTQSIIDCNFKFIHQFANK